MIQSIANFNGENGIYELPPARFIGIRHNHLPGSEGARRLGSFIEVTFESKLWNEVVLQLPNIIPNEPADLTCEYVAETDSFYFIVGVFAPKGTEVPAGCDYRDIAPTLVWIWKKEQGKDSLTELNKLSDDQYVANFGEGESRFPWQAFLRADEYSVYPIKKAETKNNGKEG